MSRSDFPLSTGFSVFVADDLVYVVELRGKRVAPVAGDGKQDDRRVEDRAEPEISRIDFIGDVLREEPCRAQSERVAEHRTHVPVAEVRRDERVGLVKPRLDIAPGVEIPRQRQGAECLVTRFHLLVVRHEVRPQCVVDLGAARECHRSDDRHDGGGAEQTAEIIESLHRIEHRFPARTGDLQYLGVGICGSCDHTVGIFHNEAAEVFV